MEPRASVERRLGLGGGAAIAVPLKLNSACFFTSKDIAARFRRPIGPKQGFAVPLAAWFRGHLRESFRREVSGSSGLANSGYFGKAITDRATPKRS